MRLLISRMVVLCLVVRNETRSMKVWWRVAVRLLLVNGLIHLLDRPFSTCGDVHHTLKRTHRCAGGVPLVGAGASYRAHPYTTRRRVVVVAVSWWCSLELLDARGMVELWVRKGARVLRVA